MYDKPYTMPVDSFVVDDLSFPQYDRVYKVGLKFELDVPCLCTNDDRIVIRSVPFTYNYIPNDFNSNLVAPFRAYYILDDNTPLYFGALTDSNINTFEIVPSVGNQDIDFDLYFLFNSEGKNRQNISFRFEVFYCGEVIGVEVIQTIQIDDDGNLVYSQLVTIS